MPTIGSNGNFAATSISGIYDRVGRTIISTRTDFSEVPLGIAPTNSILFGLPNATFNLTPNDPNSIIGDGDNPLPYWSITNNTDNVGYGSAIFDATTQTWGVNLNLGTAASGSWITLTTRSYVVTDDNLALRQKAFLTLSKVGTYAGTTQQNLTLTATYYDNTNAAVATATIGTALDNGTATSISGYTYAGGSALPSSVAFVDLELRLTATAAVTSGISFTVKSLLLATSSTTTGSFVITETFTASGTWKRPVSVTNLVAVVAIGGGGGGGGGGIYSGVSTTTQGDGGAGGASSSWAILKDLYVGDVSTVTIGVGAGGNGGAGTAFSKANGGTVSPSVGRTTGSAGGASTFGTYLTVPGGGGALTSNPWGSAGATPTTTSYGMSYLGAVAPSPPASSPPQTVPNGSAAAYTQLPYVPGYSTPGSAVAGSYTTTGTAVSATGAAAGTSTLGVIGGGAGGGQAQTGATSVLPGGNGGAGGAGAGGGAAGVKTATTGTHSVIGGNGGNAAASSGAGGGGGGGAAFVWSGSGAAYNTQVLTVNSGNGGNGGSGVVYVVYVA